ncbi:MAG: hypothetical protein QM770_17530 [Tepidisphaeraceae bacterium]
MATDPRDYKIEIRSLGSTEVEPETEQPGKKYIRVFYACCKTYNRVYANRDGSAYEARCPKCGRSMRFAVGPGGTDQRSFVVE